jgi:hypothetical protein
MPAPMVMRWPIGFSFAQNWRAMASLMMATPGAGGIVAIG